MYSLLCHTIINLFIIKKYILLKDKWKAWTGEGPALIAGRLCKSMELKWIYNAEAIWTVYEKILMVVIWVMFSLIVSISCVFEIPFKFSSV